MVWLYLTSLSILLGAEVNAQLEGLRDPYRARLRPKRPIADYRVKPGQRADATPTATPTATSGGRTRPIASVPADDPRASPPMKAAIVAANP